jgi:hypothetical protein
MVDGPCDLLLGDDRSVRPVARVDQAQPVALMDRSSTWQLMSSPDPLTPGEETELRLLHVGDPARFFESEPSLFVGDPWAYQMDVKVDEASQVRSVTVGVPETASELPVSLFCDPACPTVPNQYPQTTWTLPVAGSLDPRWSQADAYPYRITGGETEFWEWTAYVMGINGISKATFFEHTRVQRPDGVELEYTSQQTTSELSRVRLNVKWEDLVGLDSLEVVDEISGQVYALPVRGPYTLEEAVSRIESVGEGMVWHRLVANGDLCPIALELKDAEGNTLSPEAELVTLEADGAEIVEQPTLLTGAYDLYGLIRTQDCEESDGEVRVIAADGRLLSTHSFSCRPEGLLEFSPEFSWASLSAIEDSVLDDDEENAHGAGVTHTLHVHANNLHDEPLGADALIELHVTGGQVVGPKLLLPLGDLQTEIAADPGQHALTVEVLVNGTILDTLNMDVDLPVPEKDAGVVDTADAGVVDTADAGDSAVQPPSGGGGGGGCDLGGDGPPAWWAVLMVLGLVYHRRWRPS